MNESVNKYLEEYDEVLAVGVPGIYQIWKEANDYYKSGDIVKAKKCEQLIYFLHNSIVYADCELGKVNFAYGGIGTVIHKNAEIADGVMIGQGVTIGGNPGKYRVLDNKRLYVPKINENVYIAAGSRILGGIEIGSFSVIGANSVVTKDTPPYQSLLEHLEK